MSADAQQSPAITVHHLMAVIFFLVILQLFTLGGIFYVLSHGQIVSFTLPRKTSSTTTPAAGECSPIASAHRSAVPVRRGPLAPVALSNPLAGSRLIAGAGFRLPPGASNTGAHRSPHAAGQRSNFVRCAPSGTRAPSPLRYAAGPHLWCDHLRAPALRTTRALAPAHA